MRHTPLYLATRLYVAMLHYAGRKQAVIAQAEASAAEEFVAAGMATFKRTNPAARVLSWMGRV